MNRRPGTFTHLNREDKSIVRELGMSSRKLVGQALQDLHGIPLAFAMRVGLIVSLLGAGFITTPSAA